MFLNKYKPTDLNKFIGNIDTINSFNKWISSYETNKNFTSLIYGPTGIGKTLFINLIFQTKNYNKIYYSFNDELTTEIFTNKIFIYIQNKVTYDNKKNVLIFDDIDSINDSSFILNLIKCIKTTKIPIICICNDKYNLSLKPILNLCVEFKFCISQLNTVLPLIKNIIQQEKIIISQTNIENLFFKSNGDIRYIINALEFNLQNNINNKDIQNLDIFNTTEKLLDMDLNFKEKYDIFWQSYEIHPLMIQENYINNTLFCKNDLTKLENISYSSDSLSDADIFNNISLNENNLNYVATSIIQSTIKCNKKVRILFTKYLKNNTLKNNLKKEKYSWEKTQYYNLINKPQKTKTKTKTKKID